MKGDPPEADIQRERQRLAERKQDFEEVFRSEAGERVLRHLRARFETRLPAFRTPELAEFPPENCTTMAAIRDGHREVIEFITDQAS